MSQENESSENKFGFKDKEKALDTISRLREFELQYQKLTVRGLLGRARRVLTMTKAEDKLRNINEAIEVFEKWLEENGASAANKNSKTENNDKVETVPGLGFKDKEAAEKTLQILAGRDPEYQKLAVKGLIGSSKRVLSGTKNEEKIKCIKEGVQILENFLDKFEKENRIRLNKGYLPYSVIESYAMTDDKLASEFLQAYGGDKANGNYKHLRTIYPKGSETTSWDIIRNEHLKTLDDKVKNENLKLFTDAGEPTKIHLDMIHWAYSPQPDKVKIYAEKLQSKTKKRRSASVEEENSGKRQKLN